VWLHEVAASCAKAAVARKGAGMELCFAGGRSHSRLVEPRFFRKENENDYENENDFRRGCWA
jgi:hypothetical protein